jgi:dolichol-phosphate mannosyltransferase
MRSPRWIETMSQPPDAPAAETRDADCEAAPTISVVVAVFDEIESLSELYRRVRSVLDELAASWELVLVDDGSSDGSREVIQALAEADPRVVPLLLSRNFGHQLATTAGLDRCRGRAVVIMDADLQDPPEVIPALVARWQEGAAVVSAVRTTREGESRFKRVTARAFYRLLARITDVAIPLDTGDFRLLDRRAVDVLSTMRERHRYLRGLSAWIGFPTAEVPYERRARFAGRTKYPLRKMVRLALSAITSFSYVPLQFATLLGFVVAIGAVIAVPIVIALRLVGVSGLSGQTTVLVAVLFLGGVQLLSIGLLGEYVGRISDEVKGRPLYVLDEVEPPAPPRRPVVGTPPAPQPEDGG